MISRTSIWSPTSRTGVRIASSPWPRPSLSNSSPLDASFDLDTGHPLLRHRVYHLEGTSEFWTIDFVLQAHSRRYVFDAEDKDAVRPLFDRAEEIRFHDHPWQPEDLGTRLAEIEVRYRALRPWVIKQVQGASANASRTVAALAMLALSASLAATRQPGRYRPSLPGRRTPAGSSEPDAGIDRRDRTGNRNPEHIRSRGPDGFYSVALPVGTYSLNGRSPLIDDGATSCHGSHNVTVQEGATAKMDVICDIP